MPNLGDCPGESVYDSGMVRVESFGPNEQAAENAMRAQLPQAKIDAETAGTAAYRAALAVGDAACKPGAPPCDRCEAIFLVEPVEGPWTAVGTGPAIQPRWLARGGYKWTVKVICECPPAIEVEDKPEKKC